MEQVLSAFLATAAEFLAPTLAWARREVPFYARRISRRARLEDLPFLTREQAVAHQRALLARGTLPFAGTASPGRAGLLRVPRTVTEVEALEAFPGHDDEARALVLEVRAVVHGLAPPPHQRRWLRAPWSPSRNALRLVETVLARPQAGARVERLLIDADALMPLTAWFVSRGVDARRFALQRVSTTGARLSAPWRALVEQAWGTCVVDRFSVPELPSFAEECRVCGFNHWYPPPVWPEIVDPRTRRPIDGGVGVLVVTTLHPFVQAMPLLRYWTGALVEVGPRCRATGERGVRFRGHQADSVVDRDGLVLGGQDVVDALGAEPLVARTPHPLEVLGLVSALDCGEVKYELLPRAREVRVRVELKFDPRAFPEQARALGERVATALLAKNAILRRLDRTGARPLVVELTRPGARSHAWPRRHIDNES